MARPSKYSEKVADRILEQIADGISLRSICAQDDMPNRATVFRWLAANNEFRDQYTRAREAQADTLFDEILDIADNAANDWMERDGEDDRGWTINGDHIQRSKLRIEARKWMAGKLRPKKYGDKLELSGDVDAPLVTEIVIRGVSSVNR